jgi:ABC-type phosphate transport system substrate-binding protein
MRRLVSLLAALLLPALAAAEGFVVVVHPQSPATSLSRKEVARLFLRQATTWPGGAQARPVDQPRTAPVREAFSQAILDRSAAQVDAYWTQAVFSGRAVPPPERRSDAEVLAYVRETPGSIGYVSPDAPLEGVRKLALQP